VTNEWTWASLNNKTMELFEKIRKGLDEQSDGKTIIIDPNGPLADFSDNYDKNNTHESPIMSHNHALWATKGEVILGRIPNQIRGKDLKENKRVNRYLAFQEKRIIQATSEGNFDKATLIWCSILHRSIGYQIGLLNRVIPGWYWKLSSEKLSHVTLSMVNKLRRWNLSLLINRFYILKKNGKTRPIGAPSPASKVIAKAFTDMITYYSTKDRHDMQHGYRYGRGTHTALWEVLKKIKQGYKIMEFDFKSFFNTVSLSSVFKRIGIYGPYVAYTISNLLATDTVKTVDGFQDEKEYTRIEGFLYKKSGLPQGLSLSSILATLVLESKITPENLVMYADDGLYFYREGEKNKFSKWIDSLYWYGIRIEPEKSGTVVNKEFKFLGVKFDMYEKKLSYEGHTIDYDISTNEAIQTWLKMVAQWYGRKKAGWHWDVEPTSMITTLKLNLSLWQRIIITLYSLWNAESWKGYRYFLGSGIHDVLGSSSESCNKLIHNVKNSGNLAAYKAMKLTEMGAFKPGPHKRKGYSYKIEHVWPPNYQPWKVSK